jgi:hypothetical protein
MDFANESYVRVYTRDTMTWKRLSWQARCVWSLLLRKLDRAGVLELEGLDPVEAVCLAIELPPEVVEEGVPKLLERGVIEVRDGVLVAPRFLEAQECTKSDTLRAREYRERRRGQAMSGPSQTVTRESPPVTGPSPEITERPERHATITLCSAVLPSADPLLTIAELSELSGNGLATWVLNEHARRYYALRTRPPGRLDREEMAGKLAAWVEGASASYRLSNRDLAAKILTGLFASEKAGKGHFSLSWAVQSPEEFCGLPDGSALPPSRAASKEAAAADQNAAIASQTARLKKEFAESIRRAKELGDEYSAEVLAAERDMRLSRLQAQAS